MTGNRVAELQTAAMHVVIGINLAAFLRVLAEQNSVQAESASDALVNAAAAAVGLRPLAMMVR